MPRADSVNSTPPVVAPEPPTSPNRRAALAALASAAAMAPIGALASQVHVTGGAGQLVELDRQHYALELRYDELDAASVGHGHDQFERCYEQMGRIFDQKLDLRETILTTRAVTLADTAVQAMLAFWLAESYEGNCLVYAVKTGDLRESLFRLRTALASIVTVLAPAAGLRIDQIADPELARTVAQVLAETEQGEDA